MAEYMTYALWGGGHLDPKNAAVLLDEYIPDNVGTVYRPNRITRDQAGLKAALNWFESPDFLGEGGAVATTDPIESLLADHEQNGDEVFLLALWPEEPTEDDFAFIEYAQNSGITVLDLSRAMDELDLSVYTRPAPPKPAKEDAPKEDAKPATRRRRTTKATASATETTTVPAGPDVNAVPDEIAATEPTPAPTVEENPVAPVEVPLPEVDQREIELQLRVANAYMALGAVQQAYTEAMIELSLYRRDKALGTEIRAALEQDVREDVLFHGDVPFDGPYVGVDTKTYYRNKDGYMRPAEGKPRRGELTVELTAQEIQDYTISGLIK